MLPELKKKKKLGDKLSSAFFRLMISSILAFEWFRRTGFNNCDRQKYCELRFIDRCEPRGVIHVAPVGKPTFSHCSRSMLPRLHVFRSRTFPRSDRISATHVLVAPPSSLLASIAVTIRTAYHVTGRFLSINGVGSVNSSVGVVSSTALPTSYALCRTTLGQSTCKIDARSSRIVLDEMCPPA